MLNKINHTQISNDFLDIYMKELTGAECKVFLVIARKTIGWHKDTDNISLSQIMNITGLSNRKVIDAIRKLEEKDIIKTVREKSDSLYNSINNYTINYEESSQVVKKVHKGCEQNDKIGSEESSHTKETYITKETKQKKQLKYPSITEVKEYIENKNLNVDYNFFFTFFNDNDWFDSKGNKVINWKQKILTWSKYNKDNSKKSKENEALMRIVDGIK